MITKRVGCLLVALTLSSVIPVWACKLPVFRYALERWPVDRYRMVAIVDQADDPDVKDALAVLRSLDRDELNLDVEIVELGKLSDAELWQVEGIEDGVTSNRLQVYFPTRKGSSQKCWDGELTGERVQAWFDSPLRRALADDVVTGVSAVWIQVDGSDDEMNDRVARDLASALDQAESEIVIPEGVIPRVNASEYLRQHPEASMDDVLRCDVPLKVDFRIRRLSRDDPAEWATLAMIGGLSDEVDHPVLVPVFGRGRMLDAIPTESVNAESILRACRYMVSECSCTVKALNPGTDLLLNVDWQGRLGENILMVDVGVPNKPMLINVPDGAVAEEASAPPGEPGHTKPGKANCYVVAVALLLALPLAIGYWSKRRASNVPG